VRSTLAILAALAAVAACGHRAAPADAAVARAPSPVPGVPPPAPPPPEFPPGTRSLRLARSAPVRLAPGTDAERIGTVAQDTRVAWSKTARAPGCQRSWVEIAPRGWVCADVLRASDRAPTGVELPRLDPDELVPGVYGKVTEDGAPTWRLVTPEDEARARRARHHHKPRHRHERAEPAAEPASQPDDDDAAAAPAPIVDPDGRKMVPGDPLVGSVNVRKYAEVVVGGKTFWKIDPHKGVYLLATSIRQHAPSEMHGVRLADDTGLTLPVAFVVPRGHARSAWSHARAGGGAGVRRLAARTAVGVLETAADRRGAATAYRIGAHEWIAAADARLVEAAAPPPGLGAGERWIDVDLDREVVVAYEGTLPVYATLVSSGVKDHPTEPGVYRIWRKLAETDMRGLTGESPYSVATVPWTQFFAPEQGLALHTAYWHDRFGRPVSHGCVNLAPVDARWLYFWTDPWVPPGWTMAAGVVEAPGSIVRVRSAAEPAPPLKGYAVAVAARPGQRHDQGGAP
jgi:L,D-transpeptidase catalytic domain